MINDETETTVWFDEKYSSWYQAIQVTDIPVFYDEKDEKKHTKTEKLIDRETEDNRIDDWSWYWSMMITDIPVFENENNAFSKDITHM